MTKLKDYHLSLRKMDTEKTKGLERTFRVRAGKYRIIFYVDNAEKTIYDTRRTNEKSIRKNRLMANSFLREQQVFLLSTIKGTLLFTQYVHKSELLE